MPTWENIVTDQIERIAHMGDGERATIMSVIAMRLAKILDEKYNDARMQISERLEVTR